MVAIASAGNIAFSGPISYSLPTSAITSQQQNTYRSADNLAQISTYSKSVDTPFSSSSKSRTDVTNPGIYHSLSYAASPAAIHYAAPAPAAAIHYAAPAPAAIHYAAPAASAIHYAAPAPLPYASTTGPAVAAPGPVVSHTDFSGLGYSYHF